MDIDFERGLMRERDFAEEQLRNAQAYIRELQRRINSQHRYIQELESQLEASVVEEIRTELSAQEEEAK